MSNTTEKSTGQLKGIRSWHGAAIRVLVGIRLGLINDACKSDAINALSGKSPKTFNISNLNLHSRAAYHAIKKARMTTQAKSLGIEILHEYNLVA
ncbi:hypothetical protein ACTXIV_02610 [Psychrobacter celer]|uniref:hypothetical protein n=1 Tax=Psychrobacter celer TaxID=306572 RepID=UPI003FD689E1